MEFKFLNWSWNITTWKLPYGMDSSPSPLKKRRDKSSSELLNMNNNQNEREVKTILYDGHYYDVTDWIDHHPGGSIIKFYTNSEEDATMAIQQFHYRSREKVMNVMKRFKIVGSVLDKKIKANNNNYGDIENDKIVERNARLTKDFTKLYEELKSEGFFEPSIGHLIFRIVDILGLAILGIYILSLSPNIQNGFIFLLSKFFGAFFLALSFGRCGFLGHEACHVSLSGNKTIDGIIAKLSYGTGLGVSPSWWTSQHSRHHAMPQRLHRDVDLMTLPLIAFNSKVLEFDQEKNYQGTTKNNLLVRYQSLLFLTLDTVLVASFWKYYLNPRYALKKRKYLDLIFMTFHHVMQYMLLSQYGIFMYIFGVWMSTTYMFGNFSLSHTHLPVTDKPIHWLEYGLMHTQDVDISWWPWLCDYWMGYLSCQVEHHLFPTMPHFRTRHAKPQIQALAAKHKIPYLCQPYTQAVMKTYRNLRDISDHLKTT